MSEPGFSMYADAVQPRSAAGGRQAARSLAAISAWPLRAAKSAAVRPSWFFSPGSAPAARSASTRSVRPRAAAKDSGVLP